MNHGRISRIAIVLAMGAGAFLLMWQNTNSPNTRDVVSTEDKDTTIGELNRQTAHRSIRAKWRDARPVPPQAPERLKVYGSVELAPAWTVRFGGEFWRRPEHSDASAVPDSGDGSVLRNAPFSVGDVIERVTHALQLEPASGLPQVEGGSFLARFDGEGVRFSPHRPAEVSSAETALANPEADEDGVRQRGKPERAPFPRPQADPTTEMRFRTVSIQRDGEVFFSPERGNSEWSVLGNTAQALLSPEWGVVEHYETSDEGVAVAWVFSQPLPGGGPIEVVAAVDGLSYAGYSPEGHHFADRDGVARVRVGRAAAVDAIGNRWELAMLPMADNHGRFRIELPAEIQTEAVYPLVIDPILKAEFGMDQPVSGAASGSQANPAVTKGVISFLVVWEDNRHSGVTGTDIYGTRVSSGGAILDPLGIAICATDGSQNSPSVAVFGTTFLVVWRDGRLGGSDIFGARVLSTGVVSDPLGFAISVDLAQNSKFDPAVASGSPGFLVVWEDDRNAGINGTDIYGARVNTAGVVLDPLGIAISTDGSDQFNPTIVTNTGNGFFVAWQDDRNAGSTGTDIYGARVSTAGVLLDPIGVALSTAANNQTEPAAAANGGKVLVTWRDRRTSGTTSDDIYGARLTFTGNTVNVLDPTGLGISTNAASQRTPAVCANSNEFLVVWRDRRNTGTTDDDIFCARMDNNGVVLEPTGMGICTNAGNQTAPAVAGGTIGALVVWTDPRNSANTGNDIFGARVSIAGVLQETNGMAISRSGAAQSSPAVAFNGTNYLVAWQDERNSTTNSTDILGTRVTASGSIANVLGIKICTLTGAQRNPSVTASGGGFLVAWEDSRNALTTGIDIYGTRVTGAGTVADPAGLALSTATGDQTLPSAAGNPSTFLVAWADERNGQPEIFGTRVSQAGAISNPGGLVISSTGNAETRPCVGANSNGFLVVWEDNNNDILGARVTSAGVVSDPSGSPIRICTTGSGSFPIVAGLGTNFLAAWVDDRSAGDTSSDIYAARVAGDGTVPDFDGFAVCTSPTSQFNPAMAAGTNDYLLVWEDQGLGHQLYSARIAPSGAVLEMWGVPLTGSGDRITPALAYGGANKYLLVSEAFRKNSQRVAANILSSAPAVTSPIVQFSAAAYTIAENGKFAKVTIKLSGTYSGALTVDVATADGTATGVADYMPQAGRAVFTAGRTSFVVMVPIVDDLADEINETVTLTLQKPIGGAWPGLGHTAKLTILDNDP